MTDSAEAGSVTPEASAGTPATQQPGADNGSAAPADTSPFSGLSEGTRKWVETKGYKNLDEAVAGGMHAEAKLGAVVTVPAADAPKEEWDAFVAKLPEDRRPIEAPDKLDFKRPEGLPPELPYNEELAAAVKPWMHEAGLSKGQAQSLHDKFAQYMADQVVEQQKQIVAQVEKTHDDLVKDWGPVDSDGFKKKHELADRAMKQLGLVDAYKAKGILLADGSLTDPQIARAFSAIGERMFAEDTIGGNDAAFGVNPFKRNEAGERDVAGISALVRSDPDKAKRLAREAGENPDVWVSSNPR